MLLDSAPTAPAGTPAVAAHSAADRTSAIAACLALATVGFVTSMGMPMVVEALIDQYRYREGQAGYVASAEYLGMFAASVVVSSLILRVSRRKLAGTGILVAVASNAVSLMVTALPHLLVIRFLSGLGCGMAYAVAVAVLAGKRPELAAKLERAGRPRLVLADQLGPAGNGARAPECGK